MHLAIHSAVLILGTCPPPPSAATTEALDAVSFPCCTLASLLPLLCDEATALISTEPKAGPSELDEPREGEGDDGDRLL